MVINFIISCIILIVLLLILSYLLYKPGLYVSSSIDNKDYFVAENKDKNKVADMLAQIRINMDDLVIFMKKENNEEMKPYVEELEKKLKNIEISENTKNIYTSYAINKEELVFCVRSKKTNKLHNMNLIMYVVLHEMAHLANPEYGHGDQFKKIFKYFIESAVKCGLYHKIDFENYPAEYCGMNITVG